MATHTLVPRDDSKIVLLNKLMETQGYVDHKLIMSTVNEMMGIERIVYTQHEYTDVVEYKRGPYYYNRSDNRRHMVVTFSATEDDEEVVYETVKTIRDGEVVREFEYLCFENGDKQLIEGEEIYGDTKYYYEFSDGMLFTVYLDKLVDDEWVRVKVCRYENGVKESETLY